MTQNLALVNKIRQVASELTRLERRLRQVETTAQGRYRATTGGSTTYYDNEGVPQVVIGEQPDGTSTVKDVNSPPLDEPSAPVLVARPGTITAAWDGLDYRGFDDWPTTFSHVEVHVSLEPGFEVTNDTDLSTISSVSGGVVTFALAAEITYHFRLAVMNTSGVRSIASAEMSAAALPVETEQGIKVYREDEPPTGLGLADVGSFWFDTNDGNHQHMWTGTEWVSVQDTQFGAINDALDQAFSNLETKNGISFNNVSAGDPVPIALAEGDLWFKPEEEYRPYRWDGDSWEPMAFGTDSILDDAIDEFKLAVDAVNRDAIKDGEILREALADGAVDDAKLANLAIKNRHISDDAVTEAKLVDDAVTAAKLAAAAVQRDHIQDNAVTSTKLVDGAITTPKIAEEAIDVTKLTPLVANRITAGESRSSTFVQDGIPVSKNAGDIWFDSNDSFKIHRAAIAGATSIGPGQWEPVRDSQILTLANALIQAQETALAALSAAEVAQATADGAINTYYQSDAPWLNRIADPTLSTPGASYPDRWDGVLYTSEGAFADMPSYSAGSPGAYGYSPVVNGLVPGDIVQAKIVLRNTTSAPLSVNMQIIQTKNGGHQSPATTLVEAGTILEAGESVTEYATATIEADRNGVGFVFGAPDKGWRIVEALIVVNGLEDALRPYRIGDTWVDEDTDQAYRWNGFIWSPVDDNALALALSAARDAQATADAKITAYYRTTRPWLDGATGHETDLGDLWYDTSNKNKPYYWNGSSWVDVRDASIADAQNTANSKIRTFFQSTVPVSLAVGDIWTNTADQNHPYRAESVGADEIKIGEWVSARDIAAVEGSPILTRDPDGQGKWLYGRYSVIASVSAPPNYSLVRGAVILGRGLIADGVNLTGLDTADNYIGHVRTLITVNATKTISGTIGHDDGARIYLDGVSVYSRDGVINSGSPFAFIASAGTHVLDILWTEGGGQDYVRNINPAFGTQVDTLHAPKSLDVEPMILAGTQAELVTLNTVTIPGIVSDVTATETAINQLVTVDLPALDAALDSANADLNTLETVTLPALQAELDDSQGDISELNTSISQARSDITTLNNTTIPDLNTSISAARSDINTLTNTTIPNLDAELTQAQNTLTSLGNAQSATQQDLDAAESALNTLNTTTLPGLRTDLNTASTNIGNLQTGLTTAQSSINTLNNDTIPALAASLTTERNRINTLNNVTIPAINTALSVADVEITALEGKFPLKSADIGFTVGGGNLLKDSGFSSGTFTNGWTIGNSTQNPGDIIQIVTNPNGNKRVRLESSAETDFVSVTQGSIPVLPSTKVTFSIWIDAGNAQPMFTIISRQPDGANPAVLSDGFGDVNPAPVDNGITVNRYIKTVTIPVGHSQVALDIRLRVTGSAYLYVDKVQAEQGDVPTAYSPKADEILPGTIGSTELAVGSVTTEKMTAGSILGDRISANTLGASAIVANSITGDKIAANAITASSIAALSITARELSARSVTASSIAANSIQASAIVANTITGNKIAANAITASSIAANAISASNIVANSITGDQIAANSISATRLTLSDPTNYAFNGQFTHGAVGVQSADWTLTKRNAGDAGVPAGAPYQFVGQATSRDSVSNNLFEVQSGDEYYVEFWAATPDSAQGFTVGLQQFQADRATTVTWQGTTMAAPSATWTKYTGSLIINNPLSKWARIWIQINATSAFGNWYVTGIRVLRKQGANLIVDGSITTSKMIAGSIQGDRIAANSLAASAIVAGSITGDRLAANSITARELTVSNTGDSLLSIGTFTELTDGPGSRPEGWTRNSQGTLTSYQTAFASYAAFAVPATDVGNVGYPGAFYTADSGVNGTLPVTPGEQYYVSAGVSSTPANATYTLSFYCYNEQGNYVTSIATSGLVAGDAALDHPTSFRSGGTLTVPSNTAFVRTAFVAATYGTTYYVDRISVARVQVSARIADGAITTPKMIAGSIHGDRISANSLAASSIVAGSITTDRMTAGTINGDRIATNSLDADRIVANSITAEKLTIAAAADNVVINGGTELLDPADNSMPLHFARGGWPTQFTVPAASVYSDTAQSFAGTRSVRLVKQSNIEPSVRTARAVPVTAGEKWYVSVRVRGNTNANGGGFYLRLLDQTNNENTAPQIENRQVLANVWTEYSAVFTIPAGVTTMRIFALMHAQVDGYTCWVDEFTLMKSGVSVRIAEGTVDASKIVASSITASAMAANSISASNLIAQTITARELSAGSITATAIAAQSIRASAIAAQQITASAIAANSITASAMAALSITASAIAANSITASALAANSITASAMAANSVRASAIAAGNITASAIAAGAVTAEKLSIGANSDNMIVNGNFADVKQDGSTYPVGWNAQVNSSYREVAGGAPGGQWLVLNAKNTANMHCQVVSDRFPVVAGDTYVGSGLFGSDQGGDLYYRVLFYNNADAEVQPYVDIAGARPISGGNSTHLRTRITGQFAVPAGAIWCRVQFYWFTSATDSYLTVNDVAVRRVVGTTVIANGAVTTDKIFANAVTAGKLNVVVGGGNLVSNSNFTDATLRGWVLRAGGSMTTSTTGGGYYGPRTVSLASAADNNVTIRGAAGYGAETSENMIPITAGRAYTVTAWFTSGGGVWRVGFEFLSSAGTFGYEALSAGSPVSGKLTKISFTAIAGTGANFVTPRIDCLSNGAQANLAGVQIEEGDVGTTYSPKTDEILPGTIQANMVGANQINAGHLAAQSITATALAANSITATAIAASAITADAIAANAITANKLNLVVGGSNMLSNSSFQDPTGASNGWIIGGAGIGFNANWTYVGDRSAFVPENVPIYRDIDVVQGRKYVVSVWSYSESNNARLVVHDTAGALQQTVYVGAPGTVKRSVIYYTANNTNRLRVHGYGQAYFDAFQIEEGDVATAYAPKTDEILPGTIQANMVGANQINATHLAALSITATALSANSITATAIATSAIEARHITAGSITIGPAGSGSPVTYATNYDPSTKETPTAAQTKADLAQKLAGRYSDTYLTVTPVGFGPSAWSIHYNVGGNVKVADAKALDGISIPGPAANDATNGTVYGPYYHALKPGRYNVTYYVRTSRDIKSDEEFAEVAVYSNSGAAGVLETNVYTRVTARKLNASASGEYGSITIPMTVLKPLEPANGVELYLRNLKGDWSISHVIVQPADDTLARFERTKVETSLLAGGFSRNPTFDDWPTTSQFPTGTSQWGSAPVRVTSAEFMRTPPYAVQFYYSDSSTQTGLALNTGIMGDVPPTQYLTVEMDFRIYQGGNNGAGLLVDWVKADGSEHRVQVRIRDHFPVTDTSKWYRLTKTVKRPQSGDGATFVRGYLMGSYGGLGSNDGAQNNIIFDRLEWRVASVEEIDAYESQGRISTAQMNAETNAANAAFNQYNTAKVRVGQWMFPADNTYINGGMLFTGSVTADKIAANSITSKQIAVGDFENLVIDFNNSNTRAAYPQDAYSLWSISGGNGDVARRQFIGGNLPGDSFYYFALGTNIPVMPGDQLYMQAEWYADSNINYNYSFNMVGFDELGNHVAFDITNIILTPSNTRDAWFSIPGSATIPANVYSVRPEIKVFPTAGVPRTGNIYMRHPILRRKNKGELIVDGTISGNHLKANSVTATAITASAITASHIGAFQINASHLSAGSITATAIAANSIYATAMSANSIRASAIESGTINATHLSAGVITATAIAAQSITATAIAAQSITATAIAARSITASALAANVITATAIGAYAITATAIAANAITATAIAAQAITATAIATGTIDAEKLRIGPNQVDLVPNGNFSKQSTIDANLPAGWSSTGTNGNAYFENGGGYNRLGLYAANGGQANSKSRPFPVVGGEQYGVEAIMSYVGSRPAAYLRICWSDYDPNPNGSGVLGVANVANEGNITSQDIIGNDQLVGYSTGNMQNARRVVGQVRAPANARFMHLSIYNYLPPDAGDSYLIVHSVSVQRATNSVQIADGAILANHITSNSITATAIDANAITAKHTLTGALIQTAAPGPNAERLVLRNDGSGGILETFAGLSGETAGWFNPTVVGGVRPGIDIRPSKTATYFNQPSIVMSSSLGNVPGGYTDIRASEAFIGYVDDANVSNATYLSINHFSNRVDIKANDYVNVYSKLYVNQASQFDGRVTVAGKLDLVSGGSRPVGALLFGSASVNTDASGIATHNPTGQNLTGVYQVFITSRLNGANRIFTLTEKNPGNFKFRVRNDDGTLAVSVNGITIDYFIIAE